VSNDRYYTSGTTEALFMLSRGYCYEPTCKERVMRWTGSQWNPKVAIAHIRGLNEGSARHDKNITDPRILNNFRNLILLCKMHHDEVDGKHTRQKYSIVLLISWKENREGNLADELDLLDWITQEKLEKLMASAIDETMAKVLGAIDKVTGISQETLDILKELIDSTLRLPYLSQEDIESLAYSAEVFQMLPDHIPALRESARSLRSLPDDSIMLYESTRTLRGLSDNADLLSYASRPLADLSQYAPMLLQAALILRDSNLGNLAYEVGAVSEAADKLRSAIPLVSEPRASSYPQQDYLAAPPSTYPSTPRWSWKSFWWGMAICATFVIALLILWTYIISHK
jgi:hypothetical protein